MRATGSSPFTGGSCTRCSSCVSTPVRGSRNAHGWSATSSANSIRTATRRCTPRSCAWPRILPSAIRWSTGRGTSAMSTAIIPPPCATPRRGSPRLRISCSTATRRMRSISGRPTTARRTSRWCCRARFQIFSPTARRASRSGWRRRSRRTLLKYMPGPDLPTGGVIVDPPAAITEAYTTGRGSFRMRARWHKEDTGRGTYLVVVTEIPWLVQKGRLVERLAELINEKKLPLVADVRDESAEDIRLVIEPRSRTVDAGLLMESLFKLSELESRIPLNMNVLVKGRIPRVVGLAEALTEWLAHRREVLLRRSRYR